MLYEIQSLSISLCSALLILLSITCSVSSQTSCTPGIRGIDIDQPPNTETARFLESSSTSQEGRQVIVPKMRLDCSGYITNWSAHTLILTEPNFLDSLTHTVTFQVWRPDSRNTNSYSLVGSNELRFGGAALMTNRTTTIPGNNNTAFFSFTQMVPETERIYFVRGDVIGWFIPAKFETIVPPLSPIFVNHDCASPGSTKADLQVINTTMEECSVCSGARDFDVISSVVPLVSIQFEALPQESACSIVERTCNVTSVTPSTTPDEPTTTATTESTTATTPPQSAPMGASTSTTTETVFIVIAVVILITQVFTIVVCVLNLIVLKRLLGKKTSPLIHRSPTFPPPREATADYEMNEKTKEQLKRSTSSIDENVIFQSKTNSLHDLVDSDAS